MSEGRYTGPEPADKPTAELEKTAIIEGLLRAMQREMAENQRETREGLNRITTDQNQTNAEVARLKSTIHMVVDNQKVMGDRVGNLESRARLASGNMRAVKVSDDEQGLALALAQEKNAALEQELSSLKQRHEEMQRAAEEAKVAAEEAKVAAEKAIAVAEDTKAVADDTKALAVSSKAELQEQTATLNRLAAIAGNPLVKDLARAIATAALTLLLGWFAGAHK